MEKAINATGFCYPLFESDTSCVSVCDHGILSCKRVESDFFPGWVGLVFADALQDVILGIRTVIAVFSMLCWYVCDMQHMIHNNFNLNSIFIAFLIILFKKYKFLSQVGS